MFCIALSRAHRRALLSAIPLFDFASRPVARRSASQLGYALWEALAGLSIGRLHWFLGSESECVVVRNYTFRGFLRGSAGHGTQQ